jgi:hypothetical protein
MQVLGLAEGYELVAGISRCVSKLCRQFALEKYCSWRLLLQQLSLFNPIFLLLDFAWTLFGLKSCLALSYSVLMLTCACISLHLTLRVAAVMGASVFILLLLKT